MQDNFCSGNPDSVVGAALDTMNQIGQGIQQLSHQMFVNNNFMVDMVKTEIQRSERERKKRRKAVIQAWVAETNDTYSLISQYDDGTQGATILTVNLVPGTEIYRIQLKGLERMPRHFGINFRQAGIWIIGDEKKMSGKVLREEMIKRGVIFNGQLTKNKIENALFQFFAPQIEKAPLLKIPALAGWDNQKFVTAETFAFEESEGFSNLPVRFRHFDYSTNTPLLIDEYFAEFQRVKGDKLRFLLMMCPISALLNTLIAKEGIESDFYLNFVILGDAESRKFANFLQIFNRNKEEVCCENLDDCIKVKDEILIFNCCPDVGESEYKKERKLLQRISMAEKIVKGELYTPDGYRVTSPVVILSNSVIRKKRALNIFIDEDFIEKIGEEYTEEDVIGSTFFEFVDFCEKNYGDVMHIIHMEKQSLQGKRGGGLRIAYAIFQKFWKSQNVNMAEISTVQESDLDEVFDFDFSFEDDVITDFVKIVRKEIHKFLICMKNRGTGDEKEIFYNDEFLWIPTQILNQMFTECGVEREKNKFLEKLKRDGELITDDVGLSRKLQVAGKRFETYQFRRELFNAPGLADIVELGGDTKCSKI